MTQNQASRQSIGYNESRKADAPDERRFALRYAEVENRNEKRD